MQQADATGGIDWEVHLCRWKIIRAHQHAAGARGGQSSGFGVQCYGFSTKYISKLKVCKPNFVLTGGERGMKLLSSQN